MRHHQRCTITAVLLALALGTLTTAAAQVAPAMPTVPTLLTLETSGDLIQGEAATLTATLTTEAGMPVPGVPVRILTTLPFFDYVGTMELSLGRTDFRGRVSVEYRPTVPGGRRLSATFAGTAEHAPAVTNLAVTVAEGTPAPVSRSAPQVLPWLTPGRATAFLLPAMLGVWLIFGYALYQLARIARAGATPARDDEVEPTGATVAGTGT